MAQYFLLNGSLLETPDNMDPPIDAEIISEHEAQWQRVRLRRDILLKESDWTQVSDAPVTKEAWAVYRQALRDLPATQQDPFTIAWPSEPEA